MKNIFPRIALISLVLLFIVFLVIGNMFIYNQQRSNYLNDFKESQQTDIKLLSQLAREGLISQNYALIEWFFKTWGQDYQTVVSLNLKNHNGFALSKYKRRIAATGDTITLTNNIELYDGSYTITLISDTIDIESKLEHLQLQLFLVNLGATILATLNIWFLFRHFTIRHLQQETRLRRIAEEKLRKQEVNRS